MESHSVSGALYKESVGKKKNGNKRRIDLTMELEVR
jgi:hypothetical protein